MLTGGEHPFKIANSGANHQNEVIQKIREGKIPMQPYFSQAEEDILRGLLAKDPESRYACRPGGVTELKAHPFFAQIDWQDLEDLFIEPPYKPPVKNDLDVCLIDEEFMNHDISTDVCGDVKPTKDEIELETQFSIPKFAYINKDEVHKLMARQAHQ